MKKILLTSLSLLWTAMHVIAGGGPAESDDEDQTLAYASQTMIDHPSPLTPTEIDRPAKRKKTKSTIKFKKSISPGVTATIKVPKEIQKLDLSSQELGKFPEELSQLKSLQELRFSRNNISEFPHFLDIYPLKFLDLSENHLREIPQALRESNLEKLFLGNNLIEQFPYWISHPGTLPKLRVLSLGRNAINVIPFFGRGLQSLQELYLHNNKITKLSQEFVTDRTALPSLRKLNLDHNQIKKIPAEFASSTTMPNLFSLSITYNKIVFVASMATLRKKITSLALENNPIVFRTINPDASKKTFLETIENSFQSLEPQGDYAPYLKRFMEEISGIPFADLERRHNNQQSMGDAEHFKSRILPHFKKETFEQLLTIYAKHPSLKEIVPIYQAAFTKAKRR